MYQYHMYSTDYRGCTLLLLHIHKGKMFICMYDTEYGVQSVTILPTAHDHCYFFFYSRLLGATTNSRNGDLPPSTHPRM